MKRNRDAGHNFERDVVNAYKKAGFPHAKTARSENLTRDAEKVDIVNGNELKHGRLPYNTQCKNTVVTPNYIALLDELEPIEGIVNVILHKRTKKVGKKFMPRGSYAFMHMRDFFQMVEDIEKYKAASAKMLTRLQEEVHSEIQIEDFL